MVNVVLLSTMKIVLSKMFPLTSFLHLGQNEVSVVHETPISTGQPKQAPHFPSQLVFFLFFFAAERE